MTDAAFAGIRQLLGSTTLRDYLSSRPPSTIVTLRTDATLERSLKVLASASITSAPLFDDQGAYLGFLDWADVARALLACCPPRSASDADARALKLRAAGAQLGSLPLAALPAPPPRPGRGMQQAAAAAAGDDGALIYRADLGTTLEQVVRRGFLAPVAGRGVRHRVAVFELEEEDDDDDEDDDEAMEAEGQQQQQNQQEQPPKPRRPRRSGEPAAAADADDACVRAIRITHVLSQSDVVRFLARHLSALGPAATLTLEQLGLARKESRGVVCVPGSMPALNALSALMSTQVSSVGVVDGGALAASLTPADLRGLVPERFDALAQPVLQFLSQRAADAAAAHAAGGASLAAAAAAAVAAGGDAAEAWDVRGAEGLRAPRPAACVSPSATLADVVRLLAGGERAVYVAGAAAGAGAGDGAGGGGATAPPLPQGVVTATDVLRVVTGFNDGDEGDGGDDAEMEEDEEAYDEEEEEEEDEEEMGGGGGAAAGGDDAADTTPAELVSANRLAGESRGAEKGSAGALNGGGGG